MADTNVLRGGRFWSSFSLYDGLAVVLVLQPSKDIRDVCVVPSVLYGMWRQDQLTPLCRKSCWVFLAVGVDCYVHNGAPWRALQPTPVDVVKVMAMGIFVAGFAMDAVCWCRCNGNRNVQLQTMDAECFKMRQRDIGKLLTTKQARTQREIKESDTWFIKGMQNAATAAHDTAILFRRRRAVEELSGITGALLKANAEAGSRIPDNVIVSVQHDLFRRYTATASARLADPIKAAAAKICISKLCIAGSLELEALRERDTYTAVATTARKLCRDALETFHRQKQWPLLATLLIEQRNEREAVERDRAQGQGKLVEEETRAGNEGAKTASLRDKMEKMQRAARASHAKARADREPSERRADRILVAAGRRYKKSVPDLKQRNAELEGRRRDAENKAFRADRELEKKEKQFKELRKVFERRMREGKRRKMHKGQDQPRAKGPLLSGTRGSLGCPPSGRQHAATSARQSAVPPVAVGTPWPPVVPVRQHRAQASSQAPSGGRGSGVGGGGGGGGVPKPARGISPSVIGVPTPQVGLSVDTLPNRGHERAGKRGKGDTEASRIGANAAPSPQARGIGEGGQRLPVAPGDRPSAVMPGSSSMSSRVRVACPPQSGLNMRGGAAVTTRANQGFRDAAASVSAVEQPGRPPPGFESASAAPGNAHAWCQSTEGVAAGWSPAAPVQPAYPPPGFRTPSPGTAGGELGDGWVGETHSMGVRTESSRFPAGLGAGAAPGGLGHGGGGHGGGSNGGDGNAGRADGVNNNAAHEGLVAEGSGAGGVVVVAAAPVAAHGNVGNEVVNGDGVNGAEQALAVVENENGGNGAEQALALVEEEEDDESNKCWVCKSAPLYYRSLPCGHEATCYTCERLLTLKQRTKCMLCRQLVHHVVPIT